MQWIGSIVVVVVQFSTAPIQAAASQYGASACSWSPAALFCSCIARAHTQQHKQQLLWPSAVVHHWLLLASLSSSSVSLYAAAYRVIQQKVVLQDRQSRPTLSASLAWLRCMLASCIEVIQRLLLVSTGSCCSGSSPLLYLAAGRPEFPQVSESAIRIDGNSLPVEKKTKNTFFLRISRGFR